MIRLAIKLLLKLSKVCGVVIVAVPGCLALCSNRFSKYGHVREGIKDISRYGRNAIFSIDKLGDEQLLARMTMLAHGVEKGFAYRERKKPFFVEKFPLFLDLVEIAVGRGIPRTGYQITMAVNALRAYSAVHHDEEFLRAHQERVAKLLNELEDLPEADPVALLNESRNPLTSELFQSFFESRWSVRSFADRDVPVEEVEAAVQVAMKTPSVCNRQPWRLRILMEKSAIDKALSLQNGNRGFGHEAAGLLIIGTDLRCFVGSTERNEPFIDAGLFSMSVMLAMHARGIGSCPLNWCVESSKDEQLARQLEFPDWFRVAMFIAYGYPSSEDCKVARSMRAGVKDILV